MIFADKVTQLRKKNGWSQEELAEMMDVSRQAVSKWEGAQSIPDINKIIQLGEVFGVTTDYLLKDDIEIEEFMSDDEMVKQRVIKLEEVNEYLLVSKQTLLLRVYAVFLSIVSFIPLTLLTELGEKEVFGISKVFAETLGMVIMLVIVVIAIGILQMYRFKMREYDFIKTGDFELGYGVKGLVQEKQTISQKSWYIFRFMSIVIAIVGVIITVISGSITDKVIVAYMQTGAFLVWAVSAALFTFVSTQSKTLLNLLHQAFRHKKTRLNVIIPVYWLGITALYIGVSAITDSWQKSWVIWPVASLLFVVIVIVVKYSENKRR